MSRCDECQAQECRCDDSDMAPSGRDLLWLLPLLPPLLLFGVAEIVWEWLGRAWRRDTDAVLLLVAAAGMVGIALLIGGAA